AEAGVCAQTEHGRVYVEDSLQLARTVKDVHTQAGHTEAQKDLSAAPGGPHVTGGNTVIEAASHHSGGWIDEYDLIGCRCGQQRLPVGRFADAAGQIDARIGRVDVQRGHDRVYVGVENQDVVEVE